MKYVGISIAALYSILSFLLLFVTRHICHLTQIDTTSYKAFLISIVVIEILLGYYIITLLRKNQNKTLKIILIIVLILLGLSLLIMAMNMQLCTMPLRLLLPGQEG